MDKEQYQILFQMEERHWWYLGMRRMVSSLLDRSLNGRCDLRILDAGCGTGGMTRYLRRYGQVAGVDVAEDAIALCRTRGLTSIARASVERLPFAGGAFDLLVSFDVLYHMKIGDDVAALTEFNRVLVPGGLAVIRLPAYEWLRGAHDVAVHTRHRYSREELGGKLRRAGFRVRKLSYVNSLLFPLAALKRIVEGNWVSLPADLGLPSPPVNQAMLGVLSLEALALRWISLPWGLSVLALATK